MDKVRRICTRFAKRVSWILFAKVALSLVVLVYAASISVTTTTYQAEIGSAVKFANNLLATDKGFATVLVGSTAAGTSCSSPITFGAVPGTANTAITGGHWVYDVQVNSTSGAAANTKFNVTLTLASNPPYGPLCIQTPASPANSQTIDCKFDVGTTLPASPYSFKVTVQ
jgi:hypothetical protein